MACQYGRMRGKSCRMAECLTNVMREDQAVLIVGSPTNRRLILCQCHYTFNKRQLQAKDRQDILCPPPFVELKKGLNFFMNINLSTFPRLSSKGQEQVGGSNSSNNKARLDYKFDGPPIGWGVQKNYGKKNKGQRENLKKARKTAYILIELGQKRKRKEKKKTSRS